MHIKRLLSGSLAVMMVATSFNVPINAKAAEIPDVEPEAGLEENQELPSSDAEISLDDETNVVVEEAAEEPEAEEPEIEESSSSEEDGSVVVPEEEADLEVEEESGGAVLRGEEDIPFTYIYDYNGGTASSADPPWKSNTGTIPGGESSTPIGLTYPSELDGELTKDGYTLVGWSKSPGDNNSSLLTDSDPDADDGITVTVNEDELEDGTSGKEITFYAVWQADAPATYTVTFNAGEGSGVMAAVNDATSPYPLPVCTFDPPAGKEFAGWLVGSDTTPKAAGTEITLTGPVTLTAAWATPAEKVTVTFDKNDGTSTTDTQEVDKDTETAIKEAVTGWTRDGYTLAGFAEDEDATSATITNGKVTASTAKTYYAVWTEWEKTITLNTNTKDASSITEDETWEAYTDANLVAWASQGLDAVGKSKFSAPKTIADLPTHIQAPNGYEFDKWMVAKQGGGYEEATNANLKPSSASDTAITLYASYKKLAASEIVDISADTVTITMDSLTYNGDDQIDSAKVIKSAIVASKDIKNYLEVKGDKVYSAYTSAEDNTEADEVKNAGKYYVIVAPKSGFSRYTGEKKVEVTVSPRTITADDIIIDKKAGADENTVNREDKEDATSKVVSFNLFYNESVIPAVEDNPETEADESSPKKEKGTVGKAVEPKVEVKFNKAATGDAVLSEDVADNFDIEYKKNDAVGTASVELKLKGSATNVTADGTLTKTFTIVDGKETADDVTSWTVAAAADKAKLAAEPTTGTETGYGPTYSKKFTRTIPAVDISSIKTNGSRLEKDFDDIQIDKIYDTEGKDISSQFEIKSRTAGDDKGTIVVAAKSDAPQYTGEYSFEYSFATKDCEVDGHTYTKHIHKADFNNDGEFWYECDDCGLRPTSASDVEGVENDEDLTGTIKHLDKTSVDFWITNGETEVKFSDTSAGIPYIGKPITVVQNSAKNALIKNRDDSITINAIDYAVTKDDKDVTNFTITPSNNDKVGTAKFVIALADDNENYTGSIVKEVKITKDVETVAAPEISLEYSYASYGDKFELTSATEGAKILYQISEDLDTDFIPTTDLSDAAKIKSFVENTKTVKYADPITVAEKNAISDVIKITAIAYKTVEGKNVYSAPSIFEVYANWNWGDVYSSDGPTSADEIPSGLWISKQTLEGLTDGKSIYPSETCSASFDNVSKTFTVSTDYSGLAKTLPNYTRKYGSYTYKSTESYRVFYNNKKLTYGTDYTVSYKNNINAGTAQIIVTGKGKYSETFVQEFTINPLPLTHIYKNVSEEIVYDEPYYLFVSPATTVGLDEKAIVVSDNGQIQKPKFTLTFLQAQYKTPYSGDSSNPKNVFKTLVEGKDFEVDYSQVKAGVTGDTPYPIQIKLIGNYTSLDTASGDNSLAGNIAPRYLHVVSAGRNLAKANVSIDAKGVVCNGQPQDSSVKTTVTLEGVKLVEGTDYTVSYAINTKIPNYPGAMRNGVYSVGNYTATITGMGTYAGQVFKTFTVSASAAKKINAKGITATPVNSTIAVTYANSQTFDVYDNGDLLTLGEDYVVVKPTAKVAKNVKATIYGIGAYTGTLASEKYEITGQTPTVEIVGDSVLTYTGDWATPALKISVPNTESGKADVTYSINANGNVTTTPYDKLNNEQFDIVWPKDSLNVGKKTVTIKGRDGNKFKTTLKYEIVAKDITEISSTDFDVYDAAGSSMNLKIKDTDALPVIAYTNAAPAVWFYYNGDSYASASSFGKANATFTFKNGFKYGSTVTVTIKGKKNFKGQVTGTFKIGAADIDDDATATVSDVVENAKFKAPTVKVVSDLTGKTLAAGAKKDYTVQYLYNSNSDAHNRYDEVVASEKMVAGTEYIARIIGAGNGFEGHKDVVFRVVDKKLDIAKATVTVNRKLLFDGKEAKLDKNDITVVLNKEVVPSEGFEIVGYTLPRDKTGALKAGTAKVKLHGVSDGTTTYGGYKEVSFTIAAAPVDYAIQFKADRFADSTNELLTIGKVQNTMTNKKDDTFVLPKTGFTATRTVYNATTKKYVTTNYVLKEYYLESDPSQTFKGGEKLYISEAPINAEKGKAVTLVAKFEKASTDPYTITFKPGKAGTTAATGKDKTVKVKRGDVYKLPKQNFTLTGYKLIGYATSEGGALAYEIGDSVSNLAAAKADVKLYGVYEKVLPSYKITYKLDGGKITSAKGKYSTSYNETTDGILPTVEKTGYTLTKWQVDGKDATVVDKALKKNVEATPVWKENEYTLVYNDNIPGASSTDAAVSGTQKYTTKQELKAAPTTTNTELTFLGWAKDKGSVKADYKAGAKNVTFLTENGATLKLYGVWKHQAYKVSFKLDSADAKAGAKITRPGDATFTVAGKDSIELAKAIKAGEDFKGWKLGETTYEVSDAAKIAALQAAIVAAKDAKKAVELIAVFAENTAVVNVTYNTSVEGYTIEAGTIKKDGTLKAASFDATKAPANKVFAGWTATGSTKAFYMAGSTIKFADATDTAITLAPTYTDATASITYDLDGGVFDRFYTVPREWNASDATTITDNPSYVTKTGYTFKGFKLASDTAENPTKVTEIKLATNGDNGKVAPVSLKAMYDVKTADVTLNLNGGALEDADAAATAWGSGAKKNVKYTDEVTLPTPKARDGYTFEGWYRTDPEKAVKNLKISKVLSDLTYNASWKPVEYKVTLTLNGCELASGLYDEDSNPTGWVLSKDKSTATKTFNIESLAIPVPTLTKDNYTVVIKTGSGDSETTATEIAKGSHANVEWRAVATENKKLTITFSGGEGATGTMDAQVIYSGKSASLTKNAFTKSGYQFKNWKVTAVENASGVTKDSTTYSDKATVTPGFTDGTKDATITITAEWEAAVNTVTFNTAGGSTAPDSIDVKADDTSISATIADPTKAGYKFAGWNTKRNGSGTSVWFTAHGDVTADAAKAAALTALKPTAATKTILYAQWKEVTYNITYDLADGALAEGETNPTTWKVSDGEVTLNNPTLEGKTFAGWKVKVGEATASEAAPTVKLNTETLSDVSADTINVTITATWN